MSPLASTVAALSLLLAQAPEVTIDLEEGTSVLDILDARAASREATADHWQRLFESAGYRRLKKREASLGRGFEDDEFHDFVLSDELLERREGLRRALERWRSLDPARAARRALDYLPPGTPLRAVVYPVIKPRSNSFVFELDTDPAIFFYVDPDQPQAVFENTMAHELHHVGLAAACRAREVSPHPNEEVEAARQWVGAFGEGLAMLAAAGGPDVHPHAESPLEDRERWDGDVARFDEDLKKVEAFLVDILDGRLATEEARNEVGFSFFGVQGPWYTVGWKMAAIIDKASGRERLIAVSCSPVELLEAYNAAAPDSSARWSESLLGRLRD